MKAAIYLIRSSGKVKIGYSKNPWKRYHQLKTGCPNPMALIFTLYCYDAPKVEKYLHNQFEDRRDNGEWFRVSVNEVLIAIGGMDLSSKLSGPHPEEEKDHQKGWRDVWDIDQHGEMPESRASATTKQMDTIESFYKEATAEEMKEFMAELHKILE